MVFDNNYVRFFKDGVLTADQLQLSATQTANGGVIIGAAAGGLGNFVGLLTDVRLWQVARSLADVPST